MQETQEITITLPREQVEALEAAVAAGNYASPSELVQNALDGWQNQLEFTPEEVIRLRELWQEGINTGPAVELDFEQLLQESRQDLKDYLARQPAHAA